MESKILSIQIPTVFGREYKFDELKSFIEKQISDNNLQDKVELIWIKDAKEMSIGAKRNELYKLSKGKYSVQIDDDDWLADDYVIKVYNACLEDKDCIGYHEWHTENGVNGQKSIFSYLCKEWMTYDMPHNGIKHARTPFFKTPILTEICQSTLVPDSRFGEDHEWSKLIHPKIKSETFINEIMYYHRYIDEPHKQKYGIK